MKKLSVVLTLIFTMSFVYGQTPFDIVSAKKSDVDVREVSAHNVWLGAKLTGTLGSNDDFGDALILSGKILYNADFGSFKLPIVSNMNLNFSDVGDITGFLTGDKGISVGIYPYKVISEKEGFNVVVHGGLAFKLLPQETLALTPKQTKIFAGFELAKNIKADSYPFTLSVTPAYNVNNLEHSNFMSLETTAILPVSGGLGVLAEYVAPFKSEYNGVFRIGLILKSVL